MKKIILDLSQNTVGLTSEGLSLPVLTLSEDTNIYGLLVPVENANYKKQLNICFAKSGIKSKIHIKIVLLGPCRVEFEPMIIVSKEQKDIECELKIECLSETEKAILKVVPAMEVSNQNIKTKHSLTISTINEDHLNYLLSRGLSKVEARKLLIDAFIGDIINKIEEIS